MKWRRILFLFFLIPALAYGFSENQAKELKGWAVAEWNRHNELVEDYKNFGADVDGHGIHRVREALYCCQRALSLTDDILNGIANLPKKRRKDKWCNPFKDACKQDREVISREIAVLEETIQNILSSMALQKAYVFYGEGLKAASQANDQYKKSPPHNLLYIDVFVSHLTEVAALYRQAESLNRQAYNALVDAPFFDEATRVTLEQISNNYKELADSVEKEALQWPEKAVKQKDNLLDRLETLMEDSKLFKKKSLMRSCYETQKQALPILETLIQNSEGEQKESFALELEKLKTSITRFEEVADQNRLTGPKPSLSLEAFKNQEETRRESFFKNDLKLDPSLFFQTLIAPTSRPCVVPLDGQKGKGQKEYSLYLDQFYRFYVQSDSPISKLVVKVHKLGSLVFEEEIVLPVKNTLSWRSYLLQDGRIFIPETKLQREYGLDLRIRFVNDPRCHTALVLSQRAKDLGYTFSFSLDEEAPLYGCDLLDLPPWQLNALRKPSMQVPNRLIYINDYTFDRDPSSMPGPQLDEHFSLLDEFVEANKKDPLALAAYVQNEISLIDSFCYREEGIFQAPGIQRNALRVYLEGQGSAWEQCHLLIYLLRSAGYPAFYAFGKPCSLPKTFVENMLFTSLPEGEKEGILQYPWVVFFDGERWLSLFPWMKEIQMSEGFNVYDFLPEEFASADRWILRYLKGDERILKHISSEDESAGKLFVAFVEEHLREEGLSLDDVGIHRTQIKRQFSSFVDLPAPKMLEGQFFIFDLDKSSDVFAKAHIAISSRENPGKKIDGTIPLVSYTSNSMPLHFKEDRVSIHFTGEEQERYLDLDKTDSSINIQVTPRLLIGSKIIGKIGSVSLERGSSSALCFHFGGATPKLTALNYDQFHLEKEETKKLHALLSFLGSAYFEKCGVAQELLAKLHKVHPTTSFAFGLAKFIEKTTSQSKEILPQVDMYFLSLGNSHSESENGAFTQYAALTTVDTSSNEHQILRDVFSDLSAVSTVKLLQLAHQYQQTQGVSSTGFLAFDSGLVQETQENPEISKSLYFSHLKDLNFSDFRLGFQWSTIKKFLGQETPSTLFAYAYMTPGFVYSPDRTYKEMGTFIFHPDQGLALISSGSLVLNGGLGSPIPQCYFNPLDIPNWQLTPDYNGYGNSYKLEIPPKISLDFKPAPDPSPTLKEAKWKTDIRGAFRSIQDFVSDPVDVVTGSFYVDEVDLILPGPFPLEIRRNYNSQNPLMGELGAGWKLSLNPFLVDQDDKLYAAEADGSVICYSYNADTARWEIFREDNPDLCNFNQKGIGSVANPFHAYIENNILYGTDGSKRFFEDGLLRKWVSASGAALTFLYCDNRLTRVESSYGEFLRFEYDRAGKILEIYARDGRRISYSYSSQGDLVKVTLPNSAAISYEYDHAHRIIRETKPHGQVLENVYKEDKVTEQYSPIGPQQKMLISATFDYQGGVTTVTDGKGGKTTYKIFQKQIYKIIDPLGLETLQAWFIDEKTWFDPQTETIQPWDQPGGSARSMKSTTDRRGLTTSYLYDERGNPIQIALHGEDLTGDGQTHVARKLTFNDHNLCVQEESLQQKTVTIYDETFPYLPKRIEKYISNHLVSYVDLDYNAQGLIEKENNNGAITRWEYDGKGFPIQRRQETGTEDSEVIIEYAYNTQGQCIKIVSDDATKKITYDIMGNLIETYKFSPLGELLSANHIGYNLNNQPIWQQTANGQNTLYFDYHASGQIKAKRQLLAPSGKTAYTLYEYDPLGHLIEEVDPLGYTTYKEYDAIGNVLSETKEGHTTKFTYEPGGFVETITSPGGGTTTRRYTTNGLLKEETYPDGTKSCIVYDILSRPIQKTKNGITWKIEYDDVNAKVLSRHVNTGETEVRKYDARGNLITFTDRGGFTWEKTYDGLNRIKSQLTPNGEETNWEYLLNMAICNLPSGETVTTTYEGGQIASEDVYDIENNRISSAIYSYDIHTDEKRVLRGSKEFTLTRVNTLGKPIKVQKGNIVETFEYDACGNCVAITDGEGHATYQTFDGLGRLSAKELPDGALFTFYYDLDSNLEKVDFPNGNTWQATYDCMGRKTSEKLLSGGESAESWEYAYVEGLLKQTKDPMGRVREYEYDSYGRLTQKCVDGWQQTYTYDPRGLLLSAEQIGPRDTSRTSSGLTTPLKEHSIMQRSYDEDGRLTYESIHLNGELLQETYQKWAPGQRQLRIGDHERTFAYQNNQLTEVASGNTRLLYAYDRSGNLEGKTTPLTHIAMYYNFAGLPDLAVMYLPGGDIQETLEWNRSGKLAAYSSPLLEEKFTYTPRGYLQTAGEEKYEFDFGKQETGTRTSAPDCQVPHHGLDTFGRVITEIVEKFSLTTQYDSMGQVTSQGKREFEWDPLGRLLKVTDASFTWEASYDALGRRLQTRHTPKNSTTVTMTSLHDPEKEFEEIGVQIGNKTFWKLYGPDSCDAVIDETGATVYLVHSTLKRLIALVSEKGLQYTEHICSSYGPQTDASIPSDLFSYAESLSWHSNHLDPTGLILMGKRYYDPKLGRFISPDPVGYPLCTDLYAYAGGDPVNYFDPDGRFFSPVYQPIKSTVVDIWNNPRFEGGVQAFGGFAEMSAGGLATMGTGGVGAAAGWPIFVHGADQFFTGMRTVFTGRYNTTVTEHMLQKGGMSPENASFANNLMSTVFTMGGAAVIRSSQLTAFPRYSLPNSNPSTVSAYNRAAFEEYKDLLRAQMEKPYVVDSNLKRGVDFNYKPTAEIGSGSTAAAIRHELATGQRVFGKLHSQKGRDTINNFEKWLRNNPTARPGDRAAAENIIKDLRNALGE